MVDGEFEAALGWGLQCSQGGLGLEIASGFSVSPRKGVPKGSKSSGILMEQSRKYKELAGFGD